MWIPDRGREGRGQVPATSPANKGAGRGDAGVLGGYSRNFTLSVLSRAKTEGNRSTPPKEEKLEIKPKISREGLHRHRLYLARQKYF